jgi:hypothetical protein
MFALALSLKWRPGVSDPTAAGWLCVVAYVVAAVLCARNGSRISGDSYAGRIWKGFAIALLLLGINKQLDFQTLLIELGRKAAISEGWYGQRRAVQGLFTLVLGLVIVACILMVGLRGRRFFRENPWAIAGAAVLLGFVFIRTSSLNHVVGGLGDQGWAWLLELAGNGFIALAAFRAARRRADESRRNNAIRQI